MMASLVELARSDSVAASSLAPVVAAAEITSSGSSLSFAASILDYSSNGRDLGDTHAWH